MRKETKIGLSVTLVLLVLAGVWFFLGNLDRNEVGFDYVDDRLKGKLGEKTTVSGTARMLTGSSYVERSSGDLVCLFFEGVSHELERKFMDSIGKEVTVGGLVKKKVSDYGECTPVKQVCGKHLKYCIEVEKVE